MTERKPTNSLTGSMLPPRSSSISSESLSTDEGVQATNDDASECKMFAVQMGYWKDPYISLFVRRAERRAPEIHRGYYARVAGMWHLVCQFIKKAGPRCQIVNLGAGFDTIYWRLREDNLTIGNYVEVDFTTVTSRKCHLIRKNKQLLQKIPVDDDDDIRLSATELHALGFHIIGADLRKTGELIGKLSECELNSHYPTLILSECVLVYLEQTSADKLIKALGEHFKSATFINYEQVNLTDRFGEVMLRNLRDRGCPLAGAADCVSLDTQEKRFFRSGWCKAKAYSKADVYKELPLAERRRIENLEMLDERELLQQLFEHYCFVVAINSIDSINLDFSKT